MQALPCIPQGEGGGAMTDSTHFRERHLADRAAIKLSVEGVDVSDAVRACLLRCVAGPSLWRAWKRESERDD